MTTVRFYLNWFKLGRNLWKAHQELQKLEDETRQWLTLMSYLNNEPERSVADDMESWLAAHTQNREQA